MRKLLISLFVLGGFICSQGQEIEGIKTNLDENGNLVGESIIVLKDKTTSQIYNSSLEWVSYTFRNTESVIQAKIENKMIRINGLSKSVFGPYKNMIYGDVYFDLSYLIQLDVKDGKLRFKASDLEQVSQIPPITRLSVELLYNKKGELKSGKKYQEMKEQIDSEMSKLLNSIIMTIEGQSETNEDDW